jgi:hypothetical protein
MLKKKIQKRARSKQKVKASKPDPLRDRYSVYENFLTGQHPQFPMPPFHLTPTWAYTDPPTRV